VKVKAVVVAAVVAPSPYPEFQPSLLAIQQPGYPRDAEAQKTNTALSEIDLTSGETQMEGVLDHRERKPDAAFSQGHEVIYFSFLKAAGCHVHPDRTPQCSKCVVY
jgi:hypothetical protein